MDFTTLNLHELYAERNARQSLLINSQSEAIAHLEHVVGAILLAMDNQSLTSVQTELGIIETLTTDNQKVVQLYGETTSDITVKSKREIWRNDLASIEAQIAILKEKGQTDDV